MSRRRKPQHRQHKQRLRVDRDNYYPVYETDCMGDVHVAFLAPDEATALRAVMVLENSPIHGDVKYELGEEFERTRVVPEGFVPRRCGVWHDLVMIHCESYDKDGMCTGDLTVTGFETWSEPELEEFWDFEASGNVSRGDGTWFDRTRLGLMVHTIGATRDIVVAVAGAYRAEYEADPAAFVDRYGNLDDRWVPAPETGQP